MIEIPGLYILEAIYNPDTRVSSTSDIEPTYNAETNEMHPFGVHVIKPLLCCGVCS